MRMGSFWMDCHEAVMVPRGHVQVLMTLSTVPHHRLVTFFTYPVKYVNIYRMDWDNVTLSAL